MNLILLALALVCFLGVVFFGPQMHGVESTHRLLAGGLAFLAAAHIPWRVP